jgi:hypothetical protein
MTLSGPEIEEIKRLLGGPPLNTFCELSKREKSDFASSSIASA